MNINNNYDRLNNKYRNLSHGFSIIEIILSIGILSLLILTTMQLFSYQNKELSAAKESIAFMEAQILLQKITLHEDVCNNNVNLISSLTPIIVNEITLASSPKIIDVLKLYSSSNSSSVLFEKDKLISPLLSNVNISKINLKIEAGASNIFPSTLTLEVNRSKLIRPLKFPQIRFNLIADPLTPPHAKKIISCASTYPRGHICGYATNGCGWIGAAGGGAHNPWLGSAFCQGFDPACGDCPPGYRLYRWKVSEGDGTLSFCVKE